MNLPKTVNNHECNMKGVDIIEFNDSVLKLTPELDGHNLPGPS